MSFIDEFYGIQPFSVSVTVGKNKEFIFDPDLRSVSNHRGKLVAFYREAKNAEELEKYGLGGVKEYLPAQEVSMPIDIRVNSDKKIDIESKKGSKYTEKTYSNHVIRVFNEEKKYIGCVDVDLTASGDISHKYCYYRSPDKAEEIDYTVFNHMDNDGQIPKDEVLTFTKNSIDETKKVKICQRNGRIVGCSVIEQEPETYEELAYQSLTNFSKDEKTPKLKTYVASCVVDEPKCSNRGGSLIPYECRVLEEDLLAYKKKEEEFQRFVNRLKEKTGKEITIKRIMELSNLPYDERREQYEQEFSSNMINDEYYLDIAKYLADEKNNKLRDFKGTYIGNILRLTDKGYKSCIVTKHQKDNQEYRLYTLIDFRGTSITQGSSIFDEMYDIDRDPNYFERLEKSDKTPSFTTKVGKDGKETLILCGNEPAPENCPEYDEFVEEFISPFAEIRPIQIGKYFKKRDGQNK